MEAHAMMKVHKDIAKVIKNADISVLTRLYLAQDIADALRKSREFNYEAFLIRCGTPQ
jgi:hypothetical protein